MKRLLLLLALTLALECPVSADGVLTTTNGTTVLGAGLGAPANTVTNAGGTIGTTLIKGDGGQGVASAAFSDVQNLALGVIHTNGLSVAGKFSNSVSFIDGANAQVVISNGVIGTVKAITNSGNIQTATMNTSGRISDIFNPASVSQTVINVGAVNTGIGYSSANSGEVLIVPASSACMAFSYDHIGMVTAVTKFGWTTSSSDPTVAMGTYLEYSSLGNMIVDTNLTLRGKIVGYNTVTTAGNGVPIIVAASRVTAQSAANASISTFTVAAADSSFEVSMNANVTAATAISTSLNCDYTDESNTARTMIFPTTSLSGAFLSGGLVITTGAFETPTMHIRCKASTTITLYTAAGTFTGVTYTAEGNIIQAK